MQIMVIGGGKVGFTLASELEKEGHDITIIDNRSNAIDRASDLLDVVCVNGNGANLATLKEGNVSSADMLIAVTGSDEINILACLLAKKMGVSSTIARVRNPEYVESIELLKDDLGLSMSINPERGAAREIVRSIHFSNTVKVSSFAKGRVELAEILIMKENTMINRPIHQIVSRHKSSILVCAIRRDEEVIIPNGDFVVQEGDRISVMGTTQNVEKFLMDTGVSEYREFNEIMLIGAGRISYYLTMMMLNMGIHVKIIEKDVAKAKKFALRFREATVICGDGTDQEFLLSENLKQMDAFIALTDNDEENVIVSLFAAKCGVERVMPKINRLSLEFLLEGFGLANAITPKTLTANRIVQYVRAMQNAVGSNVESLVTLIDGKVEALEFRVRSNCKFLEQPLKTLRFKEDVLIAYISRHGRPEIANGDSVVYLGDSLVVVTSKTKLRDINDVLA